MTALLRPGTISAAFVNRCSDVRAAARPRPAAAFAREAHRRSQRPAPITSASSSKPGVQSTDERPQPPQPPQPASSPDAFLATSTLGNGGMAAAGVVLGDWQGLDVSGQLLHGAPNLPAALACMLPLLGVCWYGVSNADRPGSGFGDIKRAFQDLLIPQLQALPPWGLCLLALGAGVGEEVLFRGFMQAAATAGLQEGAGLGPEAAAAAGVAAVSLLFGALHAISPTYFYFATAASVVLGVEYAVCGLQSAALTHFLYDWAALVYVLSEWGGKGDGGDTGDSSMPRD